MAIAVIAIKQKRAAQNPEISKQELQQQFQTLKTQYDEAKAKGYDVSEAERLGREAKQAFDKGDYKKAAGLLIQASKTLSELGNPNPVISASPSITPSVEKEKALKKLSNVKVAQSYRYITDGIRSVDDAIDIFKETKTDFIALSWGRINLIPERCSDLPQGEQKTCETKGYSYEHLKNAAAKIKSEMPDVIIGGGLSAEFLNAESVNEMTGEKLSKDQTWAMALDPKKWGIDMSKEEFQTRIAVSHNWVKGQPNHNAWEDISKIDIRGVQYDPKVEMPYYFPDNTNPAYQELFLSWVEKQIDFGVGQILIDINTKQAKLLASITGDINHQAVKDSFKGNSDIVDNIHQYGLSKGKYIYVISWATAADMKSPYSAQDLDAVMVTPSTGEIEKMKMDEEKWDTYVSAIKAKFGNIPIFVMFDQGPDYRPLEAFSQRLTKEQQKQFLRIADEFFNRKGMLFIYPLHGGMMGADNRVKARSYGKYNWYDALAPEFDTYETIKELANKKADN